MLVKNRWYYKNPLAQSEYEDTVQLLSELMLLFNGVSLRSVISHGCSFSLVTFCFHSFFVPQFHVSLECAT